ncbi:MAG: DUF3822 family protein [Flavobacteriales bacterium]
MQPAIHLKSEIFHEANSNYYQYNLLVSDYQFCYAVKDTLRNTYIVLKDYNLKKDFNRSDTFLQLQNILRQEAFADIAASRTNVIVHAPFYTMVPSALYDQKLNEALIHSLFTSEKLQNQITLHQKVNDSMMMIFTVHKRLKELLDKLLIGEVKIWHAVGLTLSDLQRYLPSGNQKKAFVYVRQFQADIIVYDGRKLLLANTFAYQSSVEFLYFLIFMLEQCETDPNTCEVALLGELEEDSMLYSELYKYVRHLNFLHPLNEERLDQSLRLKPHFYFNLFSTSLENH